MKRITQKQLDRINDKISGSMFKLAIGMAVFLEIARRIEKKRRNKKAKE